MSGPGLDGSAIDILNAWLAYNDARADITDATKTNYRRVVKNLVRWASDTWFPDLQLHDYVHAR